MQYLLDNLTIRLAGIKMNSVVDGEGVRMAIFTQGCEHKCPGCHNQHTWDRKGGYVERLSVIFDKMASLKNHRGITITGGEPFLQEEACYILAKKAHELGLDVWVYTGATYDVVFHDNHPLLQYTNVLVDGRYDESKRSIDDPYIGSWNQNVIILNEGVISCPQQNSSDI